MKSAAPHIRNMRTTITIACAAVLALLAGCDEAPAPEDYRVLVDGEVLAVEDAPEPVQELVYGAIDSLESAEARADGTVFRATCSASCGNATISVTADHCMCSDDVGCASINNGEKKAKSHPCPPPGPEE